MILPKWEELPEEMKNDSVAEYYQILKRKKFSLFVKRVFDFVVALLMLVVISPILLILSILIKIDSEGPVFYRQLQQEVELLESLSSGRWFKMQIRLVRWLL